MSPLDFAINSVGRIVSSFRPRSLPLMLRANYGRELAAFCFLPLMLGAVEGGLVGVVAKEVFAGAVSPRALNLAIAILAGAPAFSNILSFLWAAGSHGRDKVRFLVALQIAVAGGVALIALAPRSPAGLVIFVAGVVWARTCWSGVVVVRSTVWRANYPRHMRARLAGRLATVQALGLTLAAIGIGAAMKANDEAFRLLYPLGAAGGLVGAWLYSGLRVRGHRALLRAENHHTGDAGSLINPLKLRRLLLEDHRFGRYMACMFVFGTGNLMVTAPLVIMLKDRFALDPLVSILIVSAIPTMLMPLSIPVWARLLDRVHIIRFRAFHSWSFTASTTMFFLGALTGRPSLLWLGAVLKGLAFGGGVLAWNLGHHDFAPVERASQYMGVHVTLTGVRGLLAPVIGVSLYEILESAHPGAGAWTLAFCLGLTATGAIWFVSMRRTLSGPGGHAEFDEGPPVQPPAAT